MYIFFLLLGGTSEETASKPIVHFLFLRRTYSEEMFPFSDFGFRTKLCVSIRPSLVFFLHLQ